LVYFGFEIGLMMLTTGFRITFGFVFFFPLLNGLQILFTGFFATFGEVFGKIGLVVFSKMSVVVVIVVCDVLIVGPLVVLTVKVVLLVIIIGLFVVVVVVVVVVMVGLVVVLQSRAPIFLSRSQSEGEATSDPCRISKAAPTHRRSQSGCLLVIVGRSSPPTENVSVP